jgi:predicted NUDIX family NTP pyrophosphohydrolase
MEWPPRSGRQAKFPEVDRAEWVDLSTAREKLIQAQTGFIDQLEELLA